MIDLPVLPAGIAALGLAAVQAASALEPLPGMPPVVDLANVYSETAAESRQPAALQGDLERIYVPNLRSHDVYVVDPVALKVVDRFKVGRARSTSCRRGTCAPCGSPTTPRAAPTAA
jgi:YVTN family beta-propeller protein